ncbi:MAG: phosphatase PAP2 family protein [Proteobacteria bacterium]|nr:phosphatase PAP2 family protein [Pseudomonadota bacterium]
MIGRGEAARPRWWVVTGLGLAGLFVLLLYLDPVIESAARSLRQVPGGRDVVLWRDLMDGAKYLGRGVTQFLFGLVVMALGLLLGYRPLRRLGGSAAAAVAAAGIMNLALKYLIGRPRPRMYYFTKYFGYQWERFSSIFDLHQAKADYLTFMGPSLSADFTSFPSGHAMTSFALAVVLARALPGQRVWLFVLAAYISVFRVVGSSHFATDVLGGALIGTMIGWLFARWILPVSPVES